MMTTVENQNIDQVFVNQLDYLLAGRYKFMFPV